MIGGGRDSQQSEEERPLRATAAPRAPEASMALSGRWVVVNAVPGMEIELQGVQCETGRFRRPHEEFPGVLRAGERAELGFERSNATWACWAGAGLAAVPRGLAALQLRCRVDQQDYMCVCAFRLYKAGFVSNRVGVHIRTGMGAQDEKGRQVGHGVNATGHIESLGQATNKAHSVSGQGTPDRATEAAYGFCVTAAFNDKCDSPVVFIFHRREDRLVFHEVPRYDTDGEREYTSDIRWEWGGELVERSGA